MSANGFLPDSELAAIDNGQRLSPEAAQRYNAMRAAAARDGVVIVTTEGYRDYATQVYLRELYLSGQGNPASVPGTSPHGWGNAVDLNTLGWNTVVYNWLVANAARFGFNNAVGIAIGEHWHWVYDGGGDLGWNTPAASNPEANMERLFRLNSAGKTFKAGAVFYWRDGISFPVGPLAGQPVAGKPDGTLDYYALKTVMGVPENAEIGGETYEFYHDLQIKRAQAYLDAHGGDTGGGTGGPSAATIATAVDTKLAPRFEPLATKADVTAVPAKVLDQQAARLKE